MTKIFFLPGAGASADFWKPAAHGLLPDRERHFFAWPGLGNEPLRQDVKGIDDLVAMVLDHVIDPVDLVAQSMGGLVALKAVLTAPTKFRRLVLAGTSGGLPVDALGGADWRPDYRAAFPKAAPWILNVREDLSPRLSLIDAPTLLLWGDRDQVSPPRVGHRLREMLSNARLHIVSGGDHGFPQTHADEIRSLIAEHLE